MTGQSLEAFEDFLVFKNYTRGDVGVWSGEFFGEWVDFSPLFER